MSRVNAEAMCLELNREALADPNCAHWYVVSYNVRGGFHVVRVLVSVNWKPENEYDLPPNAVGPLTNCTARRKALEFNQDQLDITRETGDPIQQWAVHVKPLNRRETRNDAINSESVESEIYDRPPLFEEFGIEGWDAITFTLDVNSIDWNLRSEHEFARDACREYLLRFLHSLKD